MKCTWQPGQIVGTQRGPLALALSVAAFSLQRSHGDRGCAQKAEDVCFLMFYRKRLLTSDLGEMRIPPRIIDGRGGLQGGGQVTICAKLPRAWPCLPGSREGWPSGRGPHFPSGCVSGPSPLGARSLRCLLPQPQGSECQLIAQFLPSACLSHWLLRLEAQSHDFWEVSSGGWPPGPRWLFLLAT